MKTLAIFTCLLAIALLTSVAPVQAAEIEPETGTISYTGNTNPIQFTDINTGPDSNLYITDKENTDAVVLNPLTGDYKVYFLAVSQDAGDVQPAPNGRIWYTDNRDQLGVFDPTECSTEYESCGGNVWTFPKLGINEDIPNIGPLAFDGQGYGWVGVYAGAIPRLYRVNFTGGANLEYCPYNIENYKTHDIKYFNGGLWFGDYAGDRILRFDPTTKVMKAWELGSLAYPAHLAFDIRDGSLWWADTQSSRIGHLAFGTTDTLTFYNIPEGVEPWSVAVQDGMVWYTDQIGKIGRLDPAAAEEPVSTQVNPQLHGPFTTTCSTLSTALTPGGYFFTSSNLQFTAFNPALVPTSPQVGWTIYTMPGGSIPFGMAAASGAVFATDSDISSTNAGKLVRFGVPQEQYKVFLPLIMR